jgi:hypothetical protein
VQEFEYKQETYTSHHRNMKNGKCMSVVEDLSVFERRTLILFECVSAVVLGEESVVCDTQRVRCWVATFFISCMDDCVKVSVRVDFGFTILCKSCACTSTLNCVQSNVLRPLNTCACVCVCALRNNCIRCFVPSKKMILVPKPRMTTYGRPC